MRRHPLLAALLKRRYPQAIRRTNNTGSEKSSATAICQNRDNIYHQQALKINAQANVNRTANDPIARKRWGSVTLNLPVWLLLAGLVLILVCAIIIQTVRINALNGLADDLFYAMKSLELHILKVNANVQELGEKPPVNDKQKQIHSLQHQYADFTAQLNTTKLLLSEEDWLILKVTRALGEFDLHMPQEFVREVKHYISNWQTSNKLENSMLRLYENGYRDIIVSALQEQNLPLQFMYVALQESGFRVAAVGPKTRYGYAKGMWQFIAATARRYGLQTGPMAGQGLYDFADERHDAVKSTQAAARYLSDLYRTDAQASGLLVLAAYNWGENNILDLLKTLPENPRERNFWRLLAQHNIPQQTYDFVLRIVSAAVIGENPKLFGFDFDNPLVKQ